MPILKGAASDITANVKAGAEVNASIGGAVAKGGNSAPPRAGGSAAASAAVTQSASAKNSTTPVATVVRIPTIIIPVAWTPALLSSTRLWLDARDPLGTGSVPADNTVVSSWKDKSGGARHATATNSPLLRTSIQNSLPGVYLQEASPRSSFAVSIPSGFFNTAMHFVCVYRPVSATNTSFNTTINRGGSFNQYWNQRYHSGGTAYTNVWNIGDNLNTTRIQENLITTGPTVYREFVDGAELTGLYGTTSGFTHTDSATTLEIGTRNDNVLYLTGYVFEVLAFNTAISSADQQRLEGYLAWKWGLVSKLPTGHPYKAFSPVL